jgi:hypothetical protein
LRGVFEFAARDPELAPARPSPICNRRDLSEVGGQYSLRRCAPAPKHNANPDGELKQQRPADQGEKQRSGHESSYSGLKSELA